MLKILYIIVPLLIVLLLSGLACRHLPPGKGDVRGSPSPSPSESRESSRQDAVKQQPQVQARLVGLTLGMSLDSVIAIMRKSDLGPNKKPGTRRYDFVQNEGADDLGHIFGPSIVVDENDRVVEIYADRSVYYISFIEFTGPDGTMGELKWCARSKEIVEKLGEPQQKINIDNKFEDWVFPRLGLVLSVSNSDHSLLAARLKKVTKNETF
ncbi:MAG: hypothetical protein AB2L14_37345 [Candidatus Xenobiia bacterium LiM19]